MVTVNLKVLLLISLSFGVSLASSVSDYSCDEAGYLDYLSQYTVEQKGTSRNSTSAEFQQRLNYFVESCEKVHEWNLRGKYPMEFTFYADWHPDEFEEITVTAQVYSGILNRIPVTTPLYNNSNFRYLMPSLDPCDDVLVEGENTLRSTINKPQNCSVSWAFAVTNSIEYAIKKLYLEMYDQSIDVALSAQELIDCVGEDGTFYVGTCKGKPILWGFDYVFENGIAFRQYYPHTNVGGEGCKRIEDEQKYHIAGYEKPHVYNKLGLFDLMMKGPTAVSLGLNPEYFQYYRSDNDTSPYFDTAYWRPSVYGVVMEFNQYEIPGQPELTEWPYFAIETRLRACDSMVFRLPIRESTSDANIAGIAGFAIRPIVSELVPTPEPTIPPEPSCDEPLVPLTLVRTYSTDASQEHYSLYNGVSTENLIYEESYNGTATTRTTLCIESTAHRLVLIDSNGDGWSSGSSLRASSGSTQYGDFSTSGGSSSSEYLIHPSVGLVDETPITDCTQLLNLPLTATSLILPSGACNSESITELDLSRYENLVYIDIGDNNLNYVDRFVINGLDHLTDIRIGSNSFTNNRNGYGNNSSRSASISGCGGLKSLNIGPYSFSDYGGGLGLSGLPNLSRANIGSIGSSSYNFYGSSCIFEGIYSVLRIIG